MKTYDTHWLTKPRWWTDDREKADTSFFVWSEREGRCALAYLGVLNAFLGLAKLVLVAQMDKPDYVIQQFYLRKKWW